MTKGSGSLEDKPSSDFGNKHCEKSDRYRNAHTLRVPSRCRRFRFHALARPRLCTLCPFPARRAALSSSSRLLTPGFGSSLGLVGRRFYDARQVLQWGVPKTEQVGEKKSAEEMQYGRGACQEAEKRRVRPGGVWTGGREEERKKAVREEAETETETGS
jgi:hypothetical protein